MKRSPERIEKLSGPYPSKVNPPKATARGFKDLIRLKPPKIKKQNTKQTSNDKQNDKAYRERQKKLNEIIYSPALSGSRSPATARGLLCKLIKQNK